MENYKKKLQNRFTILTCLLCFSSAIFIVWQHGYLSKFYPAGNFGDFFRGFHVGVFISFDLVLLACVAKVGVLLKDEKKLKAAYIKTTDERNLKISELTGYKLYETILVPIFIAVIVSGYFSATVFFTLLLVMAFISIVAFSRWLYYSKKI